MVGDVDGRRFLGCFVISERFDLVNSYWFIVISVFFEGLIKNCNFFFSDGVEEGVNNFLGELVFLVFIL